MAMSVAGGQQGAEVCLPPSPWQYAIDFASKYDVSANSEYACSLTPRFLFKDDAQLLELEKHLARLRHLMDRAPRRRPESMRSVGCKRVRTDTSVWRAPAALASGLNDGSQVMSSDDNSTPRHKRRRRFTPTPSGSSSPPEAPAGQKQPACGVTATPERVDIDTLSGSARGVSSLVSTSQHAAPSLPQQALTGDGIRDDVC